MNAIRIHRTLESDTLHLPELQPLVGRTVEIVVTEQPSSDLLQPGHGDWDAVARAIRLIKSYDYDAQVDQDACDLRHANDHLA